MPALLLFKFFVGSGSFDLSSTSEEMSPFAGFVVICLVSIE